MEAFNNNVSAADRLDAIDDGSTQLNTAEFDWLLRDNDYFTINNSEKTSKFNFKSIKLKNYETIFIGSLPDTFLSFLIDIKEEVPRNFRRHSELWKM
jgi:hypothetical protein